MSYTLISSPLQGFTDYRFRNAFHDIFGGIDVYYAPYIRLYGKLDIKSGYQRDLLPENNRIPELIPQVMTNSVEEFLFVTKHVQSLGYKELNWNLGCPYPMATKKGMGSGLIADPEKIDAILDRVHAESDITVSMKMRMGYNDPKEILDVFPILEKYPIKNIGIHARIGKQLYKGTVDLDSFQTCVDQCTQKVYYNGDITSVERFNEMQNRFPTIDHWMIGRGLIADPFLPQMIKNNTTDYPKNRVDLLMQFHDTLYSQYEDGLSGSSHLLSKMRNFWEYYALTFSDPQKAFKRIKKAKNMGAYQVAVRENMIQERAFSEG
jgi:tRNA-dihydrouridine synthase